jgi:acetate kinase
MRVLVVNAGSSSLKLQVLEDGRSEPVAARSVADWDGRDVEPIARLLSEAEAATAGRVGQVGRVDAVGHRVVHGGIDLCGPTVIDEEVVERIEALTPLAPLHQQRALAGIAAARAAAPELPHVACFDTSFHTTLPEAAATYALPADWRSRWGLRRFGFHGLSHAYASRRAAELLDRSDDQELRAVTCHLGAGASLCACRGGRSVDTTMGFTPLEGLVMATRAGSVDPGLVLWLVTDAGLSAADVRDGLEHRSGLAGLAGTADMREVLARAGMGAGVGAAAGGGDDRGAGLAFEVYVHALAREVAAMTASLGGLDVLVFTGGVGEHAPEVRQAAADRLDHLGVALDPAANTGPARPAGSRPDRSAAPDPPADRAIGAADAPVAALVVTAREDLEIARQTRAALTEGG